MSPRWGLPGAGLTRDGAPSYINIAPLGLSLKPLLAVFAIAQNHAVI
jgi:hypothetical protein